MNFTEALMGPFTDMLSRTLEYLPLVLGASVIFLLGLVVSPLVGNLVKRSLRFLRTDEYAEKLGVRNALLSIGVDISLADALGSLTKAIVFVVFLNGVFEVLGLSQITGLIDDLIRYIPQVIIATVLFGAGLTFGEFFKKTTVRMSEATSMSDRDGALLGVIGKFAIVTFAGMAALVQLGIAQALVQILFAGIVTACALAVGLGSRARVEKMWEDLAKKSDK